MIGASMLLGRGGLDAVRELALDLQRGAPSPLKQGKHPTFHQ
jgi:hypothetical protein